MLEIMEKYHWDYHTYNNQPSWVLDLIYKKLELEGKIRASKPTSVAKQNE